MRSSSTLAFLAVLFIAFTLTLAEETQQLEPTSMYKRQYGSSYSSSSSTIELSFIK
ncbi:11626_t:CDS:2 [Rhizophagus irregularis]|nr:11626_t:CDS:2 [Rhizophagus irregularis]